MSGQPMGGAIRQVTVELADRSYPVLVGPGPGIP